MVQLQNEPTLPPTMYVGTSNKEKAGFIGGVRLCAVQASFVSVAHTLLKGKHDLAFPTIPQPQGQGQPSP